MAGWFSRNPQVVGPERSSESEETKPHSPHTFSLHNETEIFSLKKNGSSKRFRRGNRAARKQKRKGEMGLFWSRESEEFILVFQWEKLIWWLNLRTPDDDDDVMTLQQNTIRTKQERTLYCKSPLPLSYHLNFSSIL